MVKHCPLAVDIITPVTKKSSGWNPDYLSMIPVLTLAVITSVAWLQAMTEGLRVLSPSRNFPIFLFICGTKKKNKSKFRGP
jgi:hypothetical protein